MIAALRLALRRLLRQPGPALSALLTLGLAMGASIALYSVLQTVLLRPLPLTQPDQVYHVFREQPPVQAGPISPAGWAELEAASDDQVQFAGIATSTRVLRASDGSSAERLQVAEVSAAYFEVIGVQAALGRTLQPADQDPQQSPAAVISAQLAQRLFAEASAALGQSLTIDDKQLTIVGVMPATVAEVVEEQLWIPARFAQRQQSRGNNYVMVLARLQPSFGVASLQGRLDAISGRWAREFPENHLGMQFRVQGLLAWQTRDVASMLWLLQGAVLLVLAVACANVANLALARLAGRQREIATEAALGASRMRLMGSVLAEATLLGFGGLALGLLIAQLGLDLVRLLAPEAIPRLDKLQLGPAEWTMAIVTAVSATALSGLLPAWAATRMSGAAGLRGSRQDGAAGLRASWRRGLVVGQLAVSALLLVSCLLVLQSLSRLAAVDPGFRTDGLLTARITLPAPTVAEDGYAGMLAASAENARFLDGLLAELSALPGVQSAAAIDAVPLSGSNNWNGSVTVVGRDYPAGSEPTVEWRWFTPGYFDTLGITVQRGRLPRSETDARETVINQRFAAEHFANGDPIGQRIQWWDEQFEIVGVVSDVRQWSLGRESSAEMYLGYGQSPTPDTTTMVLRSELDPLLLAEPLRRKLQELAPEVPLFGVRSMDQIQARSLAQSTFVVQLLGVFAVTALLVSAVGLYGLLAFSVARRGQELGVRLALGASPRSVRQLVLAEALQLAVIGVSMGLIGAYFAARLLSALVYRPAGSDVWSYLISALALALVAAVAAWSPAARAARLPPMRALRAD
ncbi:MAG: ABC transporter permease [Xanthomonadales bacterium]|nr:ABC transporter permease [Xanthomonadales bacterium]